MACRAPLEQYKASQRSGSLGEAQPKMYGLIVSSNKWMWLVMATVILNTWLGLVYYCYNMDSGSVAVRSNEKHDKVYSHLSAAVPRVTDASNALALNSRRYSSLSNALVNSRHYSSRRNALPPDDRTHNSTDNVLTQNSRSNNSSIQKRQSKYSQHKYKHSTFPPTTPTLKRRNERLQDDDYLAPDVKNSLLKFFPTSSQYKSYRTLLMNSYTLSLSYMDQLTWASRRVRSLQCWARGGFYPYIQQNLRVVEPFVRNGSFLGLPPDPFSGKYPKFSDIMDLDWWNSYGKLKLGYPSLAKWDNFVANLPNSSILVQIVYEENQRCSGELLNEHIGCNLEQMRKYWLQAMAPHNITVVRELCVRFQTPEDFMSIEAFNKLLFDGIPKDLPFTLVFNEYRGSLMSEKVKGE